VAESPDTFYVLIHNTTATPVITQLYQNTRKTEEIEYGNTNALFLENNVR
jgi:hypothetical protein